MKTREENKQEELKKFWSNKSNPLQSHNSNEWFDNYYKEIFFHIQGYQSVVDVGCGSGEMSIRLSKDFDRIIGFDLSESMVLEMKKKLKDNGISNVEVYIENALNIDKVVKDNKVDVVFNNTVMQYLTIQQVETFVSRSKELLTDNGIIMLMNVLNYNFEILYYILLFHEDDKKISAFELIKKLLSFQYRIWKKKLKNKNYEYEAVMGFWHAKEDYTQIANRLDLKVEFYNSIYPPFGYRFHAKFSKNK
jgi:ubiquinone/menaquinone biosynthesis C-methylase UbiE